MQYARPYGNIPSNKLERRNNNLQKQLNNEAVKVYLRTIKVYYNIYTTSINFIYNINNN